MRTLPGSKAPAPQAAAPAASQPAQPQPQHPAAPAQQAQAGRPPPPSGRAGLPPPPPDVDTRGGGGFEKRDDDYWRAHPLRSGSYDLYWYVNKIMDWGVNGHTVAMKAIDWDASTNRPGEHHGRPVDWPQNLRAETMARMNRADGSEESEKAKKAFAYFRRDLVGNYTSLGRPESSWDKDEDGNVVPPWYDFFVWRAPDGIAVPVVLRAKLTVRPPPHDFPNFHEMRVVRDLDVFENGDPKAPIQAPMPFEVVPYVAEVHGWRTTETRTLNVNGRVTKGGFRYEAFTTEVVRVARDAVPFPHLGLSTYKDLG